MASNSVNNKKSKAHNRMVQPALPLVLGSRPRKAKPVTVEPEPESEVVASESAPQLQVNGRVPDTETQSVAEGPSDKAAEDTSSPRKEEKSQPVTPRDAPAEELATYPESHVAEEEKEVDNALASHEVEADVGHAPVAEAANSHTADPSVQISVAESDGEQGNSVDIDGHFPESTNSPVGDAGDGEPTVSSSPKLSEQTNEPRSTQLYVNGNSPSDSTPTDNEAPPLQQEQPKHEEQLNHTYDSGRADSTAEAVREPGMNGYHQAATSSFVPPATASRSFNALPSLQEHLLLLNATKEGVDIVIQINPSNAQPFVSYAHSVILFRSLRLRRLVSRQQQANHNYGSNVVTLYPARYVMPHAFEAALRFLYSDTVLGKDFFVQPHPGADYQSIRVHNLDYLLSYWVSGIELGLEPVSICAERLLNTYLDWDILEITYKYAMELASSPSPSHGKNMTGSDYIVTSSSIVKQVLQFLANHIDIKNFKLVTAMNHTLVPSRLPQVEDGRPKHNPALASMVFGSMPSSADMSPSSPQSEILPTGSNFKDTVTSNILLNVDFENLFAFNNFIQAPTIRDAATTKLMVDVVNERELRRQRIHDSHVPNKERMANSAAWEPVGIKELILETNVLHRDRVGFLVSSKWAENEAKVRT
ncbi:hypothetical protein A1O7_05839 [Cladophialophora yegresii CBS 114405]|uniref:BTB domain-containing protein n=1 Tax=Cladophialophora yegresii CBS 114405 TaxID=1182544 RepID=W9WIU4_9EURO|nr:uncharacterized protein A1O7_05839 [Cladophialophora yegresii CBS 114405]EXJ58414.1 hypothetical protein A1O7_05839 [Cladophialophora yegresii CBS 114405]